MGGKLIINKLRGLGWFTCLSFLVFNPVLGSTKIDQTKVQRVESEVVPANSGLISIGTEVVAKNVNEKSTQPAIQQAAVQPTPPPKPIFTITGYSASAEEGTADGVTADGTIASRGTCAADIRYYPFGTRFYIPGYGECIVHDTGGAIVGNHIDAFFTTREEAMDWGVRYLEVQIIK